MRRPCGYTRPGIRSFWGQVLWPVPPMRIARGAELAIRGEARPDGAGVHFAWHATGPELNHRGDTENLTPFATIPPEALERVATDEALRQGMESLRAGRLDEAIERLQAAARGADAHGVGGTCYEQLGLALLHAGRAQAALHAFTHVLVLEPEREAPLRFLAPCLDRLGRQEELLEAVTRYERIHGPHPLVQRS